jgi:hypothetical protein
MNSVRLLTVLASLYLRRRRFSLKLPLDSGDAPHIDLTAAQKQTVYQSVKQDPEAMPPQRAFEQRLARWCRIA